MNEEFIRAILSKSGITLINGLPTSPQKAISIGELAEKIQSTVSTTYRIMQTLSEWSNIVSITVPSIHAPLTLYYIKSKEYTINVTPKGITVRA